MIKDTISKIRNFNYIIMNNYIKELDKKYVET